MLAVAKTVRDLFWHPNYDSLPFPSDASLNASQLRELRDIAPLAGKERREALQAIGLHPRLVLPFLRSMQHLTCLHGSESVESLSYAPHRHRSASHWSSSAMDHNAPLQGYPLSVSEVVRRTKDPSKEVVPAKEPAPADAIPSSVCSQGPSPPFVGLLNQGSTCYLNSLLQTLFHISKFREVIYDMPTQEETGGTQQLDGDAGSVQDESVPKCKSVPLALQKVFCLLQTSASPVSTTELTASFGWSDHESFIQHDIHELTRILLDNLEGKIESKHRTVHPSTCDKIECNAIRQLFQGVMESYIDVPEANYRGSRAENFYDIQLVVKGLGNIYDSFEAMVAPEVLDGRNKYCLERNGAKTYHRAEKGVMFKRLPPVLFLHLTRFDFDPEKGDMCKVLSRWEYYDAIDLAKYVQNSDGNSMRYRLVSVLVHAGSDARFGHYYCYVKTGESEWCKFNDETVTKASLKDVFGKNFGGSKVNYWGAEVPLTTNAYLLVYVKESALPDILKPIPMDAIPQHISSEVARDRVRAELEVKFRAEAHLYATMHLISSEDVEEQPVLMVSQSPRLNFPKHRSLRVMQTEDVVKAVVPFAARQYGVAEEDICLWTVGPQLHEFGISSDNKCRLGLRVTKGTTVRECTSNAMDGSGRAGCIFVSILSKQPTLQHLTSEELRLAADSNRLVLTHHKVYDPYDLKIRFVTSLVSVDTEPLKHAEASVQDIVLARKLLTKVVSPDAHPTVTPAPDLASYFMDAPVPVAPAATKPKLLLQAAVEEEGPFFVEVSSGERILRTGDIFVWQEQHSLHNPASVPYRTLEAFTRFLRHRISVEVRHLKPPLFPAAFSAELADDMTYEQVQQFAARKLNEDDFDLLRFSRHNPETRLPYFMKNKKCDNTTLRTLLTVNSTPKLNSILYVEKCPFHVTDIEASNSFQFELFEEDGVKPVGRFWILLPSPPSLTMEHLFDKVREEVRKPDSNNSPSKETGAHLQKFISKLEGSPLRLLDVWKSRIYNSYDISNPITTKFEESAEYRIEVGPQLLPDIDPAEQMLIHVYHFSRVAPGGKVSTHGDPFSMFVSQFDDLATVRSRIAAILRLSELLIADWRIHLVHSQRVVEVTHDSLLGEQLLNFASNAGGKTSVAARHKDPNHLPSLGGASNPLCRCIGGAPTGPLTIFQSNQKDGATVAFLGLEHAATQQKGNRHNREERGLRIHH